MRISDWSSDVCSSDLESSRLCANDLQIMLFVRVNAALGSELIDLSLRDHGRCVGYDAKNLERSILDHQSKRAAEQEVAYEHAVTVTPDSVRRLSSATHPSALITLLSEQRSRQVDFVRHRPLLMTVA